MIVCFIFLKKGFGYLAASSENSPILGCIFDSNLEKPSSEGEQENTILTVNY
jgi:protoporphyrinogen oxidase